MPCECEDGSGTFDSKETICRVVQYAGLRKMSILIFHKYVCLRCFIMMPIVVVLFFAPLN